MESCKVWQIQQIVAILQDLNEIKLMYDKFYFERVQEDLR